LVEPQIVILDVAGSSPVGHPTSHFISRIHMPAIYRIEDDDGAGQSRMDGVLAGQVTFDGKTGGKSMAGDYQALLIGSEIKPLPHPLERLTLLAHKETYLSASLKGILLRVERRICLDCGHIFDSPKVVFPGAAGCLPALIVAIASFGFAYVAFRKTAGASFLVAWVVLFGVCLIVNSVGAFYVRLRFSERQIRIAQRDCPACGGTRSVSVASLAGKRVEIGKDGKWIKVSIAGKS
jgi:hypothetical protein